MCCTVHPALKLAAKHCLSVLPYSQNEINIKKVLAVTIN